QPGQQLPFRAAVKALEVRVGTQTGFLHQVGSPNLGLEIVPQLLVGYQQQVGPAQFQQAAKGFLRAAPRLREPMIDPLGLSRPIDGRRHLLFYVPKHASTEKRTLQGSVQHTPSEGPKQSSRRRARVIRTASEELEPR